MAATGIISIVASLGITIVIVGSIAVRLVVTVVRGLVDQTMDSVGTIVGDPRLTSEAISDLTTVVASVATPVPAVAIIMALAVARIVALHLAAIIMALQLVVAIIMGLVQVVAIIVAVGRAAITTALARMAAILWRQRGRPGGGHP